VAIVFKICFFNKEQEMKKIEVQNSFNKEQGTRNEER
jgi:hypothetical protein